MWYKFFVFTMIIIDNTRHVIQQLAQGTTTAMRLIRCGEMQDIIYNTLLTKNFFFFSPKKLPRWNLKLL